MEEVSAKAGLRDVIYDAIVIGAGQAGLATGYYLKQHQKRFLILEQGSVPGQVWLSRYDSLRLFTPARYSSLPGLPFPLSANVCPDKWQTADYFARYAAFHQLPVRTGQRVVQLSRPDQHFDIQTEDTSGLTKRYAARQVVVATGSSQRAFIPRFDPQPGPTVFQIHSSQYPNPSVLPAGDVLVAGTGNSAALLSVELANHFAATSREVYLSVNAPLDFKPLYLLGRSIFWWGEKTGLLTLSGDSPIGAWLKKKPQGIYCDELQQLIRKNQLSLVPEIDRFEGQEVVFKNGFRKKFGSIVWATGYQSDYHWIRLPGALDAQGAPIHREGISPVDGLYWMGLVWQRSSVSALIQGAGRDARFVVGKLVAKDAVRFQPLSLL